MTDIHQASDPTIRELPLAAGGELELRLGANRLRLRVVDSDRVIVRGRTDHDLERDVEIESGQDWVRVTDGPAGSLRVGPLTVRSGGHAPDLDVDVPRNVRISARTLSGDIEAVGIAGPSRWQSASGSIRIGAEAGPLTIETVSGDAQVEAATPLAVTCRTVSGSVRVRAPRVTALDVATTSGDVVVEALLDEGVDHTLTSVSGDVRLVSDSEMTVDLQSVAGDIRAWMPHRIDGARGRRRVTIGSGRVRVGVKTLSGDVQLRPATGATNGASADAGVAGAQGTSRSYTWADVGRDWAESAKDWAQWGAAWADGVARGRAAAGGRPRRNATWGLDATTAPANEPGAAATSTAPATADPTAPTTTAEAQPAAAPEATATAEAEPQAPEAALDDTTLVPAPSPSDIENARLDILRQLERGELDVEAAAERLAAIEAAAGGTGA